MERAIAIIVILAALALVGFTVFGPKSPTSGARGPKEATLTLTNYAITPNRVNLSSGRVKLVFQNQSENLHAIEIYDTVEQRVIIKIDIIRPRSSFTQWVDLIGGRRYQVYDPVWRKRGMEGLILTQ